MVIEMYVNQKVWYRNRFNGAIDCVDVTAIRNTKFAIDYKGKEYEFGFDSIGKKFTLNYYEIKYPDVVKVNGAGKKSNVTFEARPPKTVPAYAKGVRLGAHLVMFDAERRKIERVFVTELRADGFTASCRDKEWYIAYEEMGRTVFYDEYDLRQKLKIRYTERKTDADVLSAFRNSKAKSRDVKGRTVNRTSREFDSVAPEFMDYISPNEYHAAQDELDMLGAFCPFQ